MSESLHYTYLALTYYVRTYNIEGWKVFPWALHYYIVVVNHHIQSEHQQYLKKSCDVHCMLINTCRVDNMYICSKVKNHSSPVPVKSFIVLATSHRMPCVQ